MCEVAGLTARAKHCARRKTTWSPSAADWSERSQFEGMVSISFAESFARRLVRAVSHLSL